MRVGFESKSSRSGDWRSRSALFGRGHWFDPSIAHGNLGVIGALAQPHQAVHADVAPVGRASPCQGEGHFEFNPDHPLSSGIHDPIGCVVGWPRGRGGGLQSRMQVRIMPTSGGGAGVARFNFTGRGHWFDPGIAHHIWPDHKIRLFAIFLMLRDVVGLSATRTFKGPYKPSGYRTLGLGR